MGVWAPDSVLTAPSSAFFRNGDGWQIFVIEDGRARMREVIVGQRNVTATEVLEGLQPGEVVVLFPSEKLDERARVKSR